MGKKSWRDRLLDLLRKRRNRNTSKHSKNSGGIGPPPVGATGGMATDFFSEMLKNIYGPAVEKQMREQTKLYTQMQAHQQATQAKYNQQRSNAVGQIQSLYSSSQQMSAAIPIKGSIGGRITATEVLLRQQERDSLDADRNKRDSEERNAGRYIVIECQIKPTDEEPAV